MFTPTSFLIDPVILCSQHLRDLILDGEKKHVILTLPFFFFFFNFICVYSENFCLVCANSYRQKLFRFLFGSPRCRSWSLILFTLCFFPLGFCLFESMSSSARTAILGFAHWPWGHGYKNHQRLPFDMSNSWQCDRNTSQAKSSAKNL